MHQTRSGVVGGNSSSNRAVTIKWRRHVKGQHITTRLSHCCCYCSFWLALPCITINMLTQRHVTQYKFLVSSVCRRRRVHTLAPLKFMSTACNPATRQASAQPPQESLYAIITILICLIKYILEIFNSCAICVLPTAFNVLQRHALCCSYCRCHCKTKAWNRFYGAGGGGASKRYRSWRDCKSMQASKHLFDKNMAAHDHEKALLWVLGRCTSNKASRKHPRHFKWVT